MLDGAPYTRLVEHMFTVIERGGPNAMDKTPCQLTTDVAATVTPLRWTLTPALTSLLSEAEADVVSFCRTLHVATGFFTRFARRHFKAAGVSPDAVVQMALHLAYRRRFGRFVATYETVVTTRFHHGRTETCRSATKEVRDFVLACIAHAPAQQCTQLLRRAAQKHTSMLRHAAEGQGIDRHLLGLRIIAQQKGVQPPLFSDPVFVQSSTWDLSTSQLFAPKSAAALGFRATFEGCVGVQYQVYEDRIGLCITTDRRCGATNSDVFLQDVFDALAEIGPLLVPSGNSPKL